MGSGATRYGRGEGCGAGAASRAAASGSAPRAADDALLAVTRKLGEFRGDSRFTTWAYKFAVLEVGVKITRHAWRSAAPAIDQDWDALPDRFSFSPHEAAEWRELFATLRRAVEDQLTPHQRRIFVALVLQGVPLDVLVEELGSNRNAVYKALFEARRKLRAELAAGGYFGNEDARQL
jgi:RNA polymerase sigma-70 factor, ECF subfamily